MEDFKYCIWFIPEKEHEWNKYTNGFSPHMTIKSKLSKSSLKDFNNIISSNKKIKVRLVGKLYQTQLNDFYSLQYDIEPINKDEIPDWWPSNAHISFKYKYILPYIDDEIRNIDNEIKIKEGILDTISIYKCSGDFSTWKKYIYT